MKQIPVNYFFRKKIVFIVILSLLNSVPIFSQIAELPFSQKIQNATDIFEGRVKSKTSFWNASHSLIYTSNTIEIYKIFKGNISTPEAQIITEGGRIENEMQGSESSLQLDENSIGVFMAEPSLVVNPKTKENKMPAFRAYGSTQGFIKYDLIEKTASDPFKKYSNIEKDVYQPIESQTGQTFKIVKAFNIDQLTRTNTKKEKFWSRHFGKNKK